MPLSVERDLLPVVPSLLAALGLVWQQIRAEWLPSDAHIPGVICPGRQTHESEESSCYESKLRVCSKT